MQFKCDCQTVKCQFINGAKTNWSDILNQFESVRKNCPALREIFVPEAYWPEFHEKASDALNEAGQQYILLSAFKSGNLGKITLPIHTYLLDGEKPKVLTNNYKKDLIDRWKSETKSLKRHKEARGFNGKLAELISASWIESRGWTIENLAALGGSFDIEAIFPQGKSSAIEVKYIGEEDCRFEEDLKSMISGEAVGGHPNHYDGYNFILFKVYEAAKQLGEFQGDRYIFIVISNLAWSSLDIAIEDNWLQQYPSKFTNLASSKWKDFLSKQMKKKYPNIEKEINEVLNQIKELWIIKDKCWEYSLTKIINKERKFISLAT